MSLSCIIIPLISGISSQELLNSYPLAFSTLNINGAANRNRMASHNHEDNWELTNEGRWRWSLYVIIVCF